MLFMQSIKVESVAKKAPQHCKNSNKAAGSLCIVSNEMKTKVRARSCLQSRPAANESDGQMALRFPIMVDFM